MYTYDQSGNINDNKNPKTDFNEDDNSIDKCPICFMIFPSNMTQIGRSMHVNEHCKDE
jgi:hypothetical protein